MTRKALSNRGSFDAPFAAPYTENVNTIRRMIVPLAPVAGFIGNLGALLVAATE